MNTNLYSIEQIRRLESMAYSDQCDSEIGLMNKAGKAAFDALSKHFPNTQSILVVCGKGNNGGDGFVLAKCAAEAGLQVKVTHMSPISSYQEPALEAAKACTGVSRLVTQEYQGSLDNTADVIVDALLGIGIKGELSKEYATIIEQINALGKPVLAFDTPSGLDAETGNKMGVAVKADVTITFLGLKQGLFTHNGPAQCGTILCDSLGLPKNLLESVSATSKLMDWKALQLKLPKRARDSHKGCYGHVLIVGGDYGMGGAVRMAAEGALRVGAGLVSVATRPEHVSVVSTNRPEIMCHQVASPDELKPLLEKATVVIIGPGLGKSDWAKMLFEHVLSYDHPKLLDADALNLLSQKAEHSEHWVLTPHPGEASRLLELTAKDIQDSRFAAAKSLQKKYGGTIVLKGPGTIVQAPTGLPQICPAGNPGMASGGMGDVLSGIIGGLIAQKLPLPIAAELGVMIHALAADMAAEQGGERGLLACDLMEHIRHLVNPDE